MESKELRGCLKAALGSMPEEWRRVLLLYYVQEVRGAKLARTVRRPEEEVDRILENARAYLRGRLIEGGCVIERRQKPARGPAADQSADQGVRPT